MEHILHRAENGIARITLNRPEKRNALNAELIAALQHLLDLAAKDAATRVVVIDGAGKDFCSGMDLKALDHANETAPLEQLDPARRLADLLLAIRRHPRPVIAAIHGRALAGGAGIAMASDLIVASQSAWIGFPEIKIGFVPAMVSALLRRSVSEKRMFELLATGDSISAEEAQSIGLINRVFPDSDFEESMLAYAQGIAEKSPSALSHIKSLLYQMDGMTLEKAIDEGVHANTLARTTEDARRGFENFLKKG